MGLDIVTIKMINIYAYYMWGIATDDVKGQFLRISQEKCAQTSTTQSCLECIMWIP